MGFLDRLRGPRSGGRAPATAPPSYAPVDLEAEVREVAQEWIRPGFRSREGLAEDLVEYLELDDPVWPAKVQRIVEEEWQRRLDEQASWQGTSDYDRLTAAFADLHTQGFVCRMDFSCCQTCASTEIDDERTLRPETELATPRSYRYHEWAYTYFHQQDTEHLAYDSPTLMLAYGGFRPAPEVDVDLLVRAEGGDDGAWDEVTAESTRLIGTRIQNTLQSHGLTVIWDGDIDRRIEVQVPHWHKPLPVA